MSPLKITGTTQPVGGPKEREQECSAYVRTVPAMLSYPEHISRMSVVWKRTICMAAQETFEPSACLLSVILSENPLT